MRDNQEYSVVYDHCIVAVNRGKADNTENSIVYRDDDGLHTINLESCAKNYLIEHPESSGSCIGERNIDEWCFVIYTSGILTKIIFKKAYVFQKASANACRFRLLTGKRLNRFNKFRSYLSETRYTTMDLC